MYNYAKGFRGTWSFLFFTDYELGTNIRMNNKFWIKSEIIQGWNICILVFD